MVSLFLTIFVGATVLLCFYLYLKHTYWKRNGIPTAKGQYPIFGHMFSALFMRTNYSEIIEQIYNDYKDYSMVGIYKGLNPVLIIREPSLIKTVLQTDFSKFHENASKVEPNADPLLANNPFYTYGDTWTTARKHLTYAFSSSRLKTLFVVVNGVCTKFQAFLERRLRSSSKYEVELKFLFSKFTGEVVANASLGIEGLCFEDEEHPNAFDRIGRTIFQPSLLERIITQFALLFPQINRLMKIAFVPKEIQRYFRRIVSENLDLRRKDPTPRNDFLQLMIELEKTGDEVDEKILTAHIFSFYADGLETSSATLSYIGYHLAVHQIVQEKLRNEVKSVIAKHGGVLTHEALKEMKYMDQVINESQRFYAALDIFNKLCTKESVLEGSDGLSCRVKPGIQIVIPTRAVHHDPKYWPDPWKFDPERFNEENKQNIEKMTFLPFGEGPRMCVGMRMAMVQMKACLATLMLNYKLQLSPKTQLPLKFAWSFFTPEPIGGLWVYVSKL